MISWLSCTTVEPASGQEDPPLPFSEHLRWKALLWDDCLSVASVAPLSWAVRSRPSNAGHCPVLEFPLFWVIVHTAA